MKFNPPPNWPAPPGDFTPSADWKPDPSWGPAPKDWQLWIDAPPARSEPTTHWSSGRIIAIIALAIVTVWSLVEWWGYNPLRLNWGFWWRARYQFWAAAEAAAVAAILVATRTRANGYCVLLVVPFEAMVIFFLFGQHSMHPYTYYDHDLRLLPLVTVLASTILIARLGIIVGRTAPPPKPKAAHIQQPIGYTATGQPIYPIVGYTPDGQPVTADKVAGPISGYNQQTNSMATISLIMAFVFAPLAIVFGHIARSQIRRTGEQGAGLALAGLIIGYLSTAISIAAIIYIVVALNQLS